MGWSRRSSRDSSGSSWTGSSRQSSTEVDCRYSNDPRPWSSTDSDSSYQWTGPAPAARPAAASHSWDARGAGASSRRSLAACSLTPAEEVSIQPACAQKRNRASAFRNPGASNEQKALEVPGVKTPNSPLEFSHPSCKFSHDTSSRSRHNRAETRTHAHGVGPRLRRARSVPLTRSGC